MSNKRSKVVLGVLGCGALGALLWFTLRGPGRVPEPTSRVRQAASSDSALGSKRRGSERKPLPGGYKDRAEALASLRSGKLDADERRLAEAAIRQDQRYEQLRDATRATRLPPNSRPLTRKMTDVIKPNRRYETPKMIRDPNADAGAQDPLDEPSFLFTASKFSLQRGEKIDATLEVWDGAPSREPAPQHLRVALSSSTLFRYGQPYERVADVPINDDGQSGDAVAGDGIYSISFDPFQFVGADFNGSARFDVVFTLPSVGVPTTGRLLFQLASQPPARFTQNVIEDLTAEGLELSVEVEVKQEGRYQIQGLLFAKGPSEDEEEPIGFAIARSDWKPGLQQAKLQFFGLLFHEAKQAGPYVLRTVTGYRLPVGDEPVRRDMATWLGGYVTKAYKLSDFSSAEWESEARDRQLEGLGELADENPEKTSEDGGRIVEPADAGR